MSDLDIRWQQRFTNYKKALLQLQSAADLSKQRPLSNLRKAGCNSSFRIHP